MIKVTKMIFQGHVGEMRKNLLGGGSIGLLGGSSLEGKDYKSYTRWWFQNLGK